MGEPPDEELKARCRLNFYKNEREGLAALESAVSLFDYLIANDETQKAAQLVKLIPHNTVDHPAAIEMERWAAKINRHLADAQAYRDYYNEALVDDAGDHTDRAKFVCDWLNARAAIQASPEPLRVLEVGCQDGATGLPILKACPNIHYTGVDIDRSAIAAFHERAKKELPDGEERIRLMESMDLEVSTADLFDAVVFLEVIEHVPDPVASVKNLLKFVAPEGRLFISTPWGSYDKGVIEPTRDPRSHLRVMMPRDVVECVEKAGGRVLELHGDLGIFGSGAGLSIIVEKLPDVGMIGWPEDGKHGWIRDVPHPFRDKPPIAFVNDDESASEEIINLARQLARSGRNVEVYGPLPHEVLVEEKVSEGVKFWPPLKQLEKLPPGAIVLTASRRHKDPDWEKLIE